MSAARLEVLPSVTAVCIRSDLVFHNVSSKLNGHVRGVGRPAEKTQKRGEQVKMMRRVRIVIRE